MLKWYPHLYISDRTRKSAKRLIRRINRGKPTRDVYVLTYPTNDCNVMDIVPSSVLMQKVVRSSCPKIIGLARGREEAYELMKQILQETYDKNGNFHVQEYLEDRS